MSKITALLILLVGVVSFLAGTYFQPLLSNWTECAFPSASSTVGRYNLVISPAGKNEKFLVDSKTGKIWQINKPGETSGKSFVCERPDKIDDLVQFHPVAKSVKNKTNKEKVTAKVLVQPQTPIDNATVEIITSSKISQEKISKERNAPTKSIAQKITSVNNPN